MEKLWEIPGDPQAKNPQVAYVLGFALLVLAILGIVYWRASSLVYFRETPLDFRQLDSDDVLIVSGMNRRQGVSLKVGFLEHFDPPRVGLFGNHQFQYLTREAFGAEADPDYFYNYWFANLSLAELKGYLTHAASLDKLPRDTILVMITTPNADNGNYIITYNGELFPDMHANLEELADLRQAHDALRGMFDAWYAQLYYNLSYSSLYSSLVWPEGTAEEIIVDRILSKKECDRQLQAGRPTGVRAELSDWLPGWMVSIIPAAIRPRFAAHRARSATSCTLYHLSTALRNDGAAFEEYNTRPLRRDENPLSPDALHLGFGDEVRIASYMRDIMELGARHGRRIVFVIPPVYESVRQSPADQVFDRALRLAPEAYIVDHRRYRHREELFATYEHPGREYFRLLVEELRERGLIPQDPPGAQG